MLNSKSTLASYLGNRQDQRILYWLNFDTIFEWTWSP